eukprot:6058279-Pleurochrysis_carterae.AAC.1
MMWLAAESKELDDQVRAVAIAEDDQRLLRDGLAHVIVLVDEAAQRRRLRPSGGDALRRKDEESRLRLKRLAAGSAAAHASASEAPLVGERGALLATRLGLIHNDAPLLCLRQVELDARLVEGNHPVGVDDVDLHGLRRAARCVGVRVGVVDCHARVDQHTRHHVVPWPKGWPPSPSLRGPSGGPAGCRCQALRRCAEGSRSTSWCPPCPP